MLVVFLILTVNNVDTLCLQLSLNVKDSPGLGSSMHISLKMPYYCGIFYLVNFLGMLTIVNLDFISLWKSRDCQNDNEHLNWRARCIGNDSEMTIAL